MKNLLFLQLILFASVYGCQSTRVKNSSLTSSDRSPEIQVLNLSGQNSRPKFSPDGAHILYISAERDRHKQRQAYIYNLSTQTDRRLTFQDGEVTEILSLITNSNNRIESTLVYASTTDEIKERPEFIKKFLNQNKTGDTSIDAQFSLEYKNLLGEIEASTEIYSSTLSGRNIDRITNSPGFDGSLRPLGKENKIAFASRSVEKPIYKMFNLASRQQKSLTDLPVDAEFLAWSKSENHMSWSSPSKSAGNSSDLWMRDLKNKNSLLLISGPGHHVDSTWVDEDSIVFSSNRSDSTTYQIFMIQKDGTCLRQLTTSATSKRHPDLSPDGKQLIFTLMEDNKSQIGLMDFSPPPCPEGPGPIQ